MGTRTIACISFSEALNEKINPQLLINTFGRFGWSETFRKLSQIAADVNHLALAQKSICLENWDWLKRTVELCKKIDCPFTRVAVDLIQNNPTRPIITEQTIYFLEALAILEGTDGGETPSDETVLVSILAANDYVHVWIKKDSGLSNLEKGLADMALITRYNRIEDPLSQLVRTIQMPENPPPRGALSSATQWDLFRNDVCKKSLSISYTQYTDLLCLIFVWANQWVINKANGDINHQVAISPLEFFSETNLSKDFGSKFFYSMSLDREKAKKELNDLRRIDGLPHAPTFFFKYPFIRVGKDTILPASPWIVQQKLSVDFFWRAVEYWKGKHPKNNTGWFNVWGDIFESWCRKIVEEASREPGFQAQILTSTLGGKDEVEDIVLQEGEVTLLVSVKLATIKEASMKQAQSPTQALAWYNDFFFKEEDGQRAGALKLLNKKIDKVRAGDYSEIPCQQKVYPMLVTFDDLGENDILYKWLEKRCIKEQVFQQKNVGPISILNVDRFERLISLLRKGVSMGDILASREKYEPMVSKIFKFSRTLHRLPYLKNLFDEEAIKIKKFFTKS